MPDPNVFHILLAIFVCPVRCWEKYERSMEAPSAEQEVFKFDFNVAPTLSMSVERDYKKLFVVDYNPDTLIWEERDNNQLAACLAKFNLSKGLNPRNQTFFKHRDEFDTLEQFNGQHVRLHAVNGKSPGPLLMTNYGSVMTIRVTNSILLDGLTMRVYGLDTEWFNDGVPYLQQCPIPPKSVFTYRYEINRQGTHIYRSTQPHFRPDGFSGLMVSKKPEEMLATPAGGRVNISTEYQLAIQDWPFVEASQQRQSGLSHGLSKWGHGLDREDKQCARPGVYHNQTVQASVAPFSILINSKGWYNQKDILTRPSRIPLTTFTITKDGYHLFRVGHLGFERALKISVEDHEIVLVIVDGAHIKPAVAQSLVVMPGDVFNFYIHGKSDPEKKIYRMIVETLHAYSYGETRQPIYGLANIEYTDVEDKGQDLDQVDFSHNRCKKQVCVVLNCPSNPLYSKGNYRCIKADEFQDPDPNDDSDMLQTRSYSSSEYEEHFISMNALTGVDGYSYIPPKSIPYFNEDIESCSDFLCNKKNVALGKSQCKCFHYKKLGYNKMIQLTLYNMGPSGPRNVGLAMPVHIPSTHVYVLKMGFPTYHANQTVKDFNFDLICDQKQLGCFDATWRNSTWMNGNLPFENREPSYVTNVLVPYGGYTVIRFRSKKAGWYLVESMRLSERENGVAFAIKIGEKEDMPAPPEDFPKDCGDFEAPPIPTFVRENLAKGAVPSM
ncbi:unnamed protein product [Bursaphelenchus xylophilus]|uniref:(pine wood nematode) hypothetical protein n=1 Tax=Bursaphelenchus xylophilus TaxID=6326 RepID=A0A1I7S4N2_BURXY|nr:unnamed protein product [Bursaphelenchus xylophilus]CAG9117251.1 unnamed protein product [Bursaphelenchus xylophilus]